MILIFATPEEGRELLGLSTRQPEILRPQTSGPCVHYDERSEHAADTDPCTYPYGDGTCPHLDNSDVLCPAKDACYAMSKVARMRDVCEAEQEERDADAATGDPVYETAAPEWVEPEPDDGAHHTYTVPATRKPHPNAWSDEEEEVIRRARNAKEAATLYYGAYPQSSRTYAAVQSRWYQLRAAGKLIEPEPEEPDFTVPRPAYRPGDRVRITHALPYHV